MSKFISQFKQQNQYLLIVAKSRCCQVTNNCFADVVLLLLEQMIAIIVERRTCYLFYIVSFNHLCSVNMLCSFTFYNVTCASIAKSCLKLSYYLLGLSDVVVLFHLSEVTFEQLSAKNKELANFTSFKSWPESVIDSNSLCVE